MCNAVTASLNVRFQRFDDVIKFLVSQNSRIRLVFKFKSQIKKLEIQREAGFFQDILEDNLGLKFLVSKITDFIILGTVHCSAEGNKRSRIVSLHQPEAI